MPRIPRARVTPSRPAGRLPRAPFDIADVGTDAQGLVDLGRGISTLADTVLDEIAKTELATASADLDKFDYEAEQQVRDAEITDSTDFDALLGGMQLGRKKVIEDISSKLGSRAKRQFGIVATKSEPYANARIARLVGQRRIPYQRGVYIEKHLDMLRRGAEAQAGVWTDVNRKWFEPGEIEIQESENINQVKQENVYAQAMTMPLKEGIEHINKSISDPKARRSLRELLTSDKKAEQLQVETQRDKDEKDIAKSIYTPETLNPQTIAQIKQKILSTESFTGDDIDTWIGRLNQQVDRLLRDVDGGDPGAFGKLLHRLNSDPDSVSWEEIEKYNGNASRYNMLVREKEDTSSFLKSSRIQGWFAKLSEDFDDEDDPLILDEAAESLRRFIIDYNTQHGKPPSNDEIQVHYDTLAENKTKAWYERLWSKLFTGRLVPEEQKFGMFGGRMPTTEPTTTNPALKRQPGETIEHYLRRI
jgi:hypothetical protein